MSSIVSGYGTVKAKKLEVAATIKFHGNSDDTNHVNLQATDQSGTYDLTIPALSQNSTILHNNSSLAVGNISGNLPATQVDINGATNKTTPASSDKFVIYSNSDNANREVSFSAIKSAIEHEHTASSAGVIEIGQSDGTFSQKSISGDVSIDANGAVTLNDKPATAGQASSGKFLQTNASNNLQSLNDLDLVNLNATGDIKSSTGNVQGLQVYIGGSQNWRFNTNGDDLQLEAYNSGTSTWNVRAVFQAS